jgi:hypothetical protein
MAWSWGDGFDLYATLADAGNGYWDSIGSNPTLVAGRFTGSQALNIASAGTLTNCVKSSNVNDAVHHLILAFRQSVTITGSSLGFNIQLMDGATAQCTIVFRSDGAILLTSGTSAGTTLATYTGAFPVINTWYAFECEVVINNSTGSFKVRKNGNTSDDFSATSLNTRGGTANNYANRITLNMNTNIGASCDDLFWRSDASSVAWLGDIRCYTRMPASDSSVQFSRTGNSNQALGSFNTSTSLNAGQSAYNSFTARYTGTIPTATITLALAYTGNMKCSLYSSAGTLPASPLASATTLTNLPAGVNTFTFSSPPSVIAGTTYWIAFCVDTNTGANVLQFSSTNAFYTSGFITGTYAAFPPTNPSFTPNNGSSYVCSVNYVPTLNAEMVDEAQQNTTTDYVYDTVAGHADFYTLAATTGTPSTVYAVTTRGYMLKSDAGNRTAAVQLKSGSTTVTSTATALTTSNWQWLWRMDLTDPATSAAWTATAVNNATVGPTVVT